ncbi:MAG: hypothetical protein RBR96_00965 [Candidatus Izemoplasmatales bacterium]|jgi:trehalose/maltose hydrolase-like predicted phosphorylase|nr:hypothetical protein [Candidatus Izemoplasmatales bacterium]
MPIIKSSGFVLEQLEALNNKYVLANGYLGISGVMDCLKQADHAHLKVGGLVMDDVEGKRYISVFNPLYTAVTANGVLLHPANINPIFHEQSLDIDNGVFSKTTVYNVNDTEIKIYSERFLDQKHKNFIYSKVKIYTNKSIDLDITHGIDLDMLPKYDDLYTYVKVENNEDIILNARLEELDKEVSIFYSFERNFRHRNKNSKIQNLETYSLKTEALRDYEIIKYIGVSAETRKNPEYLGNMIKKFKKNGYSNIFDLNKLYWERLWKNRKVEIYGNDQVERYFQYNQFQLISHRPLQDKTVVSRFGFTDKIIDNSYANELYVFKYHLNTDFKSARRYLITRINQLEEAKDFAKVHKFKGALYSDKNINLYLNALITINLTDYIERTMDKSLLNLGGLEMVLETAQFYMNYIKLNDKKTNYQTLSATSLDGKIKDIDNPALLNYLIRDCFGKTANLVALAKVDRRKEIEEFLAVNQYDKLIDKIREARRKLYLQQPNVNNLIQYYDKYFKIEDKINFPDLLNLFFIYPEEFKNLAQKETFLYYSRLTNPDAYGNFILGLCSIWEGMEKEANKYFRTFNSLNVYDSSSKVNHLQPYLDLGLSAASYHFIVYGMAKLRHDRYLLTADALIPSDVRRLEFKVKIAKNIATVKIRRNSAVIEWNEMEEQPSQ